MKILNRNDVCWCGSQKKYKKCHLDSDLKLSSLEQEGYTVPTRDLIKSNDDINKLKESAVITQGLLDHLTEIVKPGISTQSIDDFVHKYTIERGGIPATLGYMDFPKSCCTSINEVICHGIPSQRLLEEGDIVNVDVTTILDGYYTDASRMYYVGKVSKEAQAIVECAKECLEIGMAEVKPFKSIAEIGLAIQAHANSKGFSVVKDFGGHGIGKKFHEDPHVSHYDTGHKDMIMMPGMVFTIEPMINEGTYKLNILEDDWTAVTRDGKLSAQWEHTIVVTSDGYEIIV